MPKDMFVRRFLTGLVVLVVVWGITFYLGGCYDPQSGTIGIPGLGQPPGEGPQSAYNALVHVEQGGAKLVLESGAEIEVQSGATLDLQSGATTDFSGGIDLDGALLDIDADGNTSLQADTDNQIDIEINGADDFQFTANTFSALSGSTIKADTIAETTAASGVSIDSVLVKDGGLDLTTGNIILKNDETIENNANGSIALGGSVIITGGLDVNAGAITMRNDETIDNTVNGTIAIAANTVITGALDVNAGAITMSNDETIDNTVNGTIAINANTVVSGALDVNAGAITLSNDETIDNTVNGTVAVNGSVVITGALDVNGGTITMANDETLSNAYDGTITATVAANGYFDILTGNLRVGNGTADGAVPNGEDAYIEGTLEVDGELEADGAIDADSTLDVAGTFTAAGITSIGTWLRTVKQSNFEAVMNVPITPTGTLVQLAATAGSANTDSIVAGTAGDILILLGPASNTVTITDTGTLKLGGTRALQANDTLVLVADGTNWNELAFVDN